MLSDAFPRPAKLVLAGQLYRVCQLRLRDLAYLESWARGGPGAEWIALATAEATEEPVARRAAFRAAYDRVESPSGDNSVSSVDGSIVTLWLALRRGQRFRHVDAVTLAERLTEAEWRTVARVAWWLDPLDECAAAIDREIGVSVQPAPIGKGDWTEAVAAVALATGWSLDRIGRLTLSQWDTIRRHCTAPEAKQERKHPVAYPDPTSHYHDVISPARTRWWTQDECLSETY